MARLVTVVNHQAGTVGVPLERWRLVYEGDAEARGKGVRARPCKIGRARSVLLDDRTGGGADLVGLLLVEPTGFVSNPEPRASNIGTNAGPHARRAGHRGR